MNNTNEEEMKEFRKEMSDFAEKILSDDRLDMKDRWYIMYHWLGGEKTTDEFLAYYDKFVFLFVREDNGLKSQEDRVKAWQEHMGNDIVEAQRYFMAIDLITTVT